MAIVYNESHEYECVEIIWMADEEVFIASDISNWIVPGTIDLSE